jgi:hypothetical protein
VIVRLRLTCWSLRTYYSILTAELSDRVATDRWHIAEASAQCRGEKADKAGESVMCKMVKRRISRVYQCCQGNVNPIASLTGEDMGSLSSKLERLRSSEDARTRSQVNY